MHSSAESAALKAC